MVLFAASASAGLSPSKASARRRDGELSEFGERFFVIDNTTFQHDFIRNWIPGKSQFLTKYIDQFERTKWQKAMRLSSCSTIRIPTRRFTSKFTWRFGARSYAVNSSRRCRCPQH